MSVETLFSRRALHTLTPLADGQRATVSVLRPNRTASLSTVTLFPEDPSFEVTQSMLKSAAYVHKSSAHAAQPQRMDDSARAERQEWLAAEQPAIAPIRWLREPFVIGVMACMTSFLGLVGVLALLFSK